MLDSRLGSLGWRAAVSLCWVASSAGCSFHAGSVSLPIDNTPDAGLPVIDLRAMVDLVIPPCTGLRCQQTTCAAGACTVPACAGGARTTVTGTVFDPAGRVPLYNVTVFVPNGPLLGLSEGAACDCETSLSGDPVVKKDENGKEYKEVKVTDVKVES